MAEANDKCFRIAIVGAGLGGLILALFLQKDCPNFRVDIYESTQELTELGAGIGFFPRVWEILRYLDLEEDLLKLAGIRGPYEELRPVIFRKGDEERAIQLTEAVPKTRGFQRSQVQNLFAAHLRDADQMLHFSKRLTSYVEPKDASEPIVLHFKDGTEATCDLLVGSDGIRSAVRRTMFTLFADETESSSPEQAIVMRSMIDPEWSGIVAYRGLAPTAALDEDVERETRSVTVTMGKNKSVISYQVSQGKLANVVANVYTPGGEGTVYTGPWVAPVTAEEAVRHFETWDSRVPRLLKHMEHPLLWAIHRVRKLPTFVRGRVALLGDAAHAMTPFQASGAGQAIEDGFILASLLAHRPTETLSALPAILSAYDAVRRPFAQDISRRSDENGHLSQLRRLGWENVSAEESTKGGFAPERLKELGDALNRSVSWAMDGSAMEERDKAITMLEVALGAE